MYIQLRFLGWLANNKTAFCVSELLLVMDIMSGHTLLKVARLFGCIYARCVLPDITLCRLFVAFSSEFMLPDVTLRRLFVASSSEFMLPDVTLRRLFVASSNKFMFSAATY